MSRQKSVVTLAFIGLLSLAVIIGCTSLGEGFLFPGTGGVQLFTPRFVFAYNEGTSTVSAFKMDGTTGALTAASNSPFSTSSSGCCARFIGVDPNSRFVYVPLGNFNGSSPTGAVAVYSVDQTTGNLTQITGSPFNSGADFAFAVAVHPTGNFIYVSNFTGGNNLQAMSVAASGALTPIGTPVAAGPDPIQLAMDPQGRFLYVVDCGSSCTQPDTVMAFSINQSTGALTAVGSAVPTGVYPRTPLVDPTGNFLYVVDMNRNNTAGDDLVSAYTINQTTGGLTALTGSPFTVGTGSSNPYGIAIPPQSDFAYVMDRQDTQMRTFTVGTDGKLTASGAAFNLSPTLSSWTHGVFADPSGKFILINDSNGDQIRVLKIGAAGAVTDVSGSPFTTGGVSFPTSLVIGH